MDLCWQCLCFLISCLGWSKLSFQGVSSFTFMAAVTICSDFGKIKSLSLFPLFLHLFAMKGWDPMPCSLVFECWVLSWFFPHSPLLPSSLLSAVRVGSRADSWPLSHQGSPRLFVLINTFCLNATLWGLEEESPEQKLLWFRARSTHWVFILASAS